MAQRVIVTMADDMDGTEETETDKVKTVHFALEKNVFAIDLRPANEEKLRGLLAPYISKARAADPEYRRTVAPVNGNGTGRTTHVPAPRDRASRERGRLIRDWAKREGIPISERGRIPSEVEKQYVAKHPF